MVVCMFLEICLVCPIDWSITVLDSLLWSFFREGNGTPLQYSCLENPMDGGVWWATVHGVAKSRTQLSDFPFAFHFHALEKEMATHSSILAWRIPGMGEPGGLLSMGSHRVRHDWSDLAAAATPGRGELLCWVSGKESTCQCRSCRFNPWVRNIPWNRKWQSTPMFLPGKSHAQRRLAGYSPWGCKRIRHNLATKQQQQMLGGTIWPSHSHVPIFLAIFVMAEK